MNMIDLLTKNPVRRAERCHDRDTGTAAFRERIAASDLGTNHIEVRDNLSVTQRLEIIVGLHAETSVVLAGEKLLIVPIFPLRRIIDIESEHGFLNGIRRGDQTFSEEVAGCEDKSVSLNAQLAEIGGSDACDTLSVENSA